VVAGAGYAPAVGGVIGPGGTLGPSRGTQESLAAHPGLRARRTSAFM